MKTDKYLKFMVRPNGATLNLLGDHQVISTMVEWGATLNNLQQNQSSISAPVF